MNKTHTRNLQFQGICWHFVFVSSLSSSSTPKVWKTGQGFDPAHEEDAKPKGPWPSQRLGAVLRNLLWPQHYTTTLGRFFANFGDAGFRNLFLFFADRDSCRWFGLAETLKTTSRQLFNVRAGWPAIFSAAARIILMSNVNTKILPSKESMSLKQSHKIHCPQW